MAEVLAKKEELADRLEKANEEAIASAIAEEEQLTREIEAEENNDINIETDNDSDFSVSFKFYFAMNTNISEARICHLNFWKVLNLTNLLYRNKTTSVAQIMPKAKSGSFCYDILIVIGAVCWFAA